MAAGLVIQKPATMNLDSPPAGQPISNQQLIQRVLERIDFRNFRKTLTVQKQPCFGKVPINTESLVRLATQHRRGEVENEAGIVYVQCPQRTRIEEPLAL